MKLVYNPRIQFLEFHNRPQRWAVLNTHRRAGKTVALVNDIIMGARAPVIDPINHEPLRKPQFAYVGPTFTQSKRVAWQYLKDYSESFWAKPPSESELKVTLVNEAVIYCLGADNPDSLRGMYLDGAVLDEYALFRPSVFSQIIRPALSDRNGWGVFASTPRGRNLFHQVFRKAQFNPVEYHLTNLSAATSGILHDEELRDLKKDLDPEEYAQEYLCSFDSALKGAIYADEVNELFAEGRAYNAEGDSTAPLYDPLLPTNFIYDIGFTDATVRIAWQVTKYGQINVVNVEAATRADVDYHIGSLHTFADAARLEGGGIGEVWLPHDARAKNLQTGKSVLEQFIAGGIRPKIVPNHKVRDRLSAARRVFPTVTIDMTPASPATPDFSVTGDLLEALKAYRRDYDEEKHIYSDQPVHDWASDFADAFGYMCVVANPSVLSLVESDMDLQIELIQSGKLHLALPGYNLETLHTEREMFLQDQQSRIA